MSGAPGANSAVLRMCDAIDVLFTRHVGPIAEFLAEETREAWLKGGNKFNATHAFEYMELLSRHIADPVKRKRFVDDAMQHLKA